MPKNSHICKQFIYEYDSRLEERKCLWVWVGVGERGGGGMNSYGKTERVDDT